MALSIQLTALTHGEVSILVNGLQGHFYIKEKFLLIFIIFLQRDWL